MARNARERRARRKAKRGPRSTPIQDWTKPLVPDRWDQLATEIDAHGHGPVCTAWVTVHRDDSETCQLGDQCPGGEHIRGVAEECPAFDGEHCEHCGTGDQS